MDISVNADQSLLQKYDLKSNNAILAEEKHKPLYEDLIKNYNVDYTAGGSAQNTARITEVKLSFLIIFKKIFFFSIFKINK